MSPQKLLWSSRQNSSEICAYYQRNTTAFARMSSPLLSSFKQANLSATDYKAQIAQITAGLAAGPKEPGWESFFAMGIREDCKALPEPLGEALLEELAQVLPVPDLDHTPETPIERFLRDKIVNTSIDQYDEIGKVLIRLEGRGGGTLLGDIALVWNSKWPKGIKPEHVDAALNRLLSRFFTPDVLFGLPGGRLELWLDLSVPVLCEAIYTMFGGLSVGKAVLWLVDTLRARLQRVWEVYSLPAMIEKTSQILPNIGEISATNGNVDLRSQIDKLVEAFEQQQISLRELKLVTNAIRRAIKYLLKHQELAAEFDRKTLSTIEEALSRSTSLQGKFELALPVIPYLLQYKLELGGEVDLEAVLNRLVSRDRKR